MSVSNIKPEETHHLFLKHNIFIVWKPEYNLGIPIIDEHHRGIVSVINSLYFGMQNNYIRDILAPIVDMMNDYTLIHFQIEENFLEKINYPKLEKHRELHHELSVKSKKLGKDSLLNRNSGKYLDFLKQWWIDHICLKDLEFRNYLLKK